jgi:2-oxoglutarate dehydrogenase E2 component (dihydrolipoamide succinyltransferase)
MAIEITVPSAGESITKVLIANWLKHEGDSVAKDELIVEIETDKATMEVPAPEAGVLAKIVKKAGENATVGDVLALLEPGAGSAAGAATSKAAAKAARGTADRQGSADARPAVATAPAPAEKPPAKPAARPDTAPPDGSPYDGAPPGGAADGGATDGEARIMPAARRLMEEAGLKPHDIQPSGPGGRILKEDVQRRISNGPARTESAATRAAADGSARPEEAVPMSPIRQKIAERLVQAQQTAALLTTFNEIDMSAVQDLRQQYQEAFTKRYGIKLGFMSFFVKAAIDALKQFPQVNAELRELPDAGGQPVPHIVYKNYYDIGVAVGGGKGLVVPVIRSAERLSFAEVEQAIADFGQRARDNKIKLEELTGGTFTISNGGIYGSLMSTPIINPPQSAILGLHAIQERPVARGGQVVIRPMMYVALSYDHRIIDGREAVTFLRRVKDAMETPTRMLIEV